ncbi:MAG TPA: hypothetical protein VN673_18840 [Clostridia bacterium]|nr:hypothetical protein [Clostridia bacterium]
MSTVRLLLVIGLLGFARCAYSSPEADLSSPSQAKRDAAATLLRATYVPTARSNWNSIISFVRTNGSRTEILKRLRDVSRTTDRSSGDIFWEHYHLDSSWDLSCFYGAKEKDRKVKGYWLKLHHAWIAPPPKFTGSWVTYYVNGQKCSELHYKEGQVLEWLEYDEGGSKDTRHIYPSLGAVYKQEIWYGPSGRPIWCLYLGTNSEVQAIIDYKEDGSTTTNWFKAVPGP